MELLTPLSLIGAIRKVDGSLAEHALIVRVFSAVLNLPIPNPERIKWAAVNRKIKLTSFLDKLKGTLIELSQR